MDTINQVGIDSFEEAVLKAKVAQICDYVGFNAITQDSSNTLVELYRLTFHHLARHCKDTANNNRRVEPTLIDLEQAYNFVGIPIDGLQEHIENVKLPSPIEFSCDEQKPSNRIQRNLLVDDLLEAEKNSHLDDYDDGNKAMSELGGDEDKPNLPLLKDTYQEISNRFTDCTPVSADKKIRLGGRIVLVASTKLKISAPIPPEPVPSTSGLDVKQVKKNRKKNVDKKDIDVAAQPPISPVKQVKGKKKKLSKEFIIPDQALEKEKDQTKDKDTNNDIDKEKEKDREKVKVKVKERDKEKEKEKVRGVKKSREKKTKVAITPLDPAIAEPPSFFPLVEDVQEPQVVVTNLPSSPISPKINKGKRKKRASDEHLPPADIEEPIDKEIIKSSGAVKKKVKSAITPLDPSIAEPPSFFPILDGKINETDLTEAISQPNVSSTKPAKGKKKKKSNNQFAIVTETVTSAEEKEWFCPACGGPDDGDLMVECDSCQEWYHLACTNLKKPPEDDENWECEFCAKKKVQVQPQTPVIETVRMKTPELEIQTPLPPQIPVVASGSQDDLCPECNLPDDGTMMIQCDDPFCAKWFHGKCVNLLDEPKEDESWFCKVCVDKQQSAFKRRRRAK